MNKKDKAGNIVKNYSLIIGLLLISPLFLIPGFMISNRKKRGVSYIGPIKFLLLINCFFLFFVFCFIFFNADYLRTELIFFPSLISFGIPIIYSIIYLREEKKNPTSFLDRIHTNCIYCGCMINNDDKFCKVCGSEII